jgi:hypothetical protein
MVAALDHQDIGSQRLSGGHGVLGVVVAAAVDEARSRDPAEVELRRGFKAPYPLCGQRLGFVTAITYSVTALSGGAQELAGTRSKSRSDSRMNAGMSAG